MRRTGIAGIGAFLVAVVVLGLLASAGSARAQGAAVVDKLNAEAERHYGAGKFAEATEIAKRALAIREKALGPEHPSVATSLSNLALLYQAQGHYAEAEPLMKRSLALYEKVLGPDHPLVGTSLNNLAALYRAQGRYAEAEPLVVRALAIVEIPYRRDEDDLQVATILENLALIREAQGRYIEAERYVKRILTTRERLLGRNHPSVVDAMHNLAGLYENTARSGEAAALLMRIIEIRESTQGPDHPDVAAALMNLAGVRRANGELAEAEGLSRKSLAIIRAALGPDHPMMSALLNNLALSVAEQHDWRRAAEFWKASTAILQRRLALGVVATDEILSAQSIFARLIKADYRASEGDVTERANTSAQMLKTAQWAHRSDAAAAVGQMSARSAMGDAGLASLVRERQDLVAERHIKDKLIIAAKSDLPEKRFANNEKALSDRMSAIDSRLNEIDGRFILDFPDYAALASPEPISVADVQALLRDDEALVVFLDTDDSLKPLPEETFVWVVTKTTIRWVRSELGTAALTREVAALRCGLDAPAWYGEGAKRCADLLEIPIDAIPGDGAGLPFDAARAYTLYKGVFGEVADLIKGKHLLIVPSGPLTTLPFQVLVTQVPTSTDLASASWLIRDHAFTVLPSVTSLKALRRTGKPSAAPKPMMGFANPLLDGNQAHPRYGDEIRQRAQSARARTGCATSSKTRTATLRMVSRSLDSAALAGGGFADLSHLRMQSPLPETADEVCDVARAIGGSVEDVRIGARATESEVKRLSATGALAKYRMLHFATHGTLAGQLSGTREPGLILTPPATATNEDDGYLSGSEIASLKLDADWVILSACNTAGGSGNGEAAEALSGLARVFFYAGARALLVSHWEVDSDAAVKLVTGAIGELTKDKSIGRGEALRRAMLAAMADTTRPPNWVPAWHPSVWAPFVVVGEGGVGR